MKTPEMALGRLRAHGDRIEEDDRERADAPVREVRAALAGPLALAHAALPELQRLASEARPWLEELRAELGRPHWDRERVHSLVRRLREHVAGALGLLDNVRPLELNIQKIESLTRKAIDDRSLEGLIDGYGRHLSVLAESASAAQKAIEGIEQLLAELNERIGEPVSVTHHGRGPIPRAGRQEGIPVESEFAP